MCQPLHIQSLHSFFFLIYFVLRILAAQWDFKRWCCCFKRRLKELTKLSVPWNLEGKNMLASLKFDKLSLVPFHPQVRLTKMVLGIVCIYEEYKRTKRWKSCPKRYASCVTIAQSIKHTQLLVNSTSVCNDILYGGIFLY